MLVFQSFESPQCLTAAVLEAVAARAYVYFYRWRFARRWRRGCRGVPPRVCRWWPGLDRVLLLERRYGCNNEAENGFWSCSHFEHAGGVELALFEAERSALPRRVCPAYPATNVCVIAPKSLKSCRGETRFKWLLESDNRAMQLFEYRSVRYWSKEIDGTLTGGRKN